MALLRYFPPQGAPILFAIHKPVVTIGRARGCDIPIRDRTISEHHAQIIFNGRDFQIEELDRQGEILINGKRKRRARLIDGDRLVLGGAQLGFSMFSEISRVSDDGDKEVAGSELAGLRKLYAFSERLMASGSVDELLETLLDDIIEVTGAARGVVLLVNPEEGQGAVPRVRASRNVRRESIENAPGVISDSIVKHVIETKRPLIVSDALTDTTFSTSESVVALQLSSVMCAPLMSQGELIGVLYVGNDEVKHLFDRRSLDLLVIFASQASLILHNALLLTALRADKEKLSAELRDKQLVRSSVRARP